MTSEETPVKSTIRAKWGKALDSGFVVIPSSLLFRQDQLGLENGELVVLLNLVMAWWSPDELPFPSSTTMAKRMGVSHRTVQRLLGQLEEKGFIGRIRNLRRNKEGRAITSYDLAGFVSKLQAATSPVQMSNLSEQIELEFSERASIRSLRKIELKGLL